MHRRTTLLAALLLASVPAAHAQTPADPTGHWQGVIEAQGRSATFEIDLATNRQGAPDGTISVPAQNVIGLPLTAIHVDGRTVAFHARTDQSFTGVLSDDGRTISGDFNVSGHTVPFSMTRTGEPKIEPPPASAAIGKDLEGTWTAMPEGQGAALGLVLTLVNRSDGTASARLVNLDEGGLELPAVITRAGSSVTLDFKVVGASFAGTLNPPGTELAGTYTQGPITVPVTFQRAAGRDTKPF